jgi:hypothetical protein
MNANNHNHNSEFNIYIYININSYRLIIFFFFFFFFLKNIVHHTSLRVGWGMGCWWEVEESENSEYG